MVILKMLSILLILFLSGCQLVDNSIKGTARSGNTAPSQGDPDDPALFSPNFTLNKGNQFTSLSSAQLAIEANGATDYAVHTTKETCENTPVWNPIEALSEIDLNTSNGINTYFLKFKNISNVTPCEQSVVSHDNQAPAPPSNVEFTSLLSGRLDGNSPIVNFTGLDTDMGVSGFKSYEARIVVKTFGGYGVVKDWLPIQSGDYLSYEPSIYYSLYFLDFRSVDNAGNQSQIVRSLGFGAKGTFSKFRSTNFNQIISEFEVGDINGDGDLDLIGFDALTSDLLILHNDGSQNFTYEIIDSNVSSILGVQDYDGDGDIDIAMVDRVYVNDGAGIFLPYLLGFEGEWVDLDNDGLIDLVHLAKTTADVFTIYWNKGDLLFSATKIHGAESFSNFEFIDFDNDGNKDFVNIENEEINWLKGNGNRTFELQPTRQIDFEFYSPEYVLFGDLNNDSYIDLIYIEPSTNKIIWQKNTIQGFEKNILDPAPATVSLSSLFTFDLDQDGDLDVFYSITSGANAGLYWIINNGNETYTNRLLYTINTVSYFEFADVNGNNMYDLLIAGGNKVLYNDGSNNFGSIEDWGNGYGGNFTNRIKQIDLDKDMDLDLLIYDAPNKILYWKEHDGAGNYIDRNFISLVEHKIFSSEMGDMNGDGHDDMVYFNENNEFAWLENNTKNEFLVNHPITKTNDKYHRFYIQLIDLDSDNDLDIVINGGGGTKSVHWYKNDGVGSFTEFNSIISIEPEFEVSFFDFNNDNEIDIVYGINSSLNGDTCVFLNDGSENFTKTVKFTHKYTLVAKPMDLEGDGDVDFVLLSDDSVVGGMYAYINNGAGVFTQNLIDSSQDYFQSNLALYDFDSDGDVDILFSESTSTMLYENDGSNNYSIAKIYSNSRAERIKLRDINNDGKMDALLANKLFNDAVLINNGMMDMTNIDIKYSTTSPYNHSLMLFDVDKDSILDVVSGYYDRGYQMYYKINF